MDPKIPIKASGTIQGSNYTAKQSSRTPAPTKVANSSRNGSLSPRSPDRKAAHLPEVPEFPRHEDVLEFPSTPEILTNMEHTDMDKAQRFIRDVFDARPQPLIDRIGDLELEGLVQVEVLQYVLAILERIYSRLIATTVVNEPTFDAVKTLRVDVNKPIEQQSSLYNRSMNIPDDTTTSTKPAQLGH